MIFDIGANIGWYTLLAARQVGPAGRVLAFEPDVGNAALLQQNAASNGMANVVVVPAAVSDRDGWATFLSKGSLQGRLDNAGDAAQGDLAGRNVKRMVPVPVLSLDAWLEQVEQPAPNLIKIDIEGAETTAPREWRGPCGPRGRPSSSSCMERAMRSWTFWTASGTSTVQSRWMGRLVRRRGGRTSSRSLRADPAPAR